MSRLGFIFSTNNPTVRIHFQTRFNKNVDKGGFSSICLSTSIIRHAKTTTKHITTYLETSWSRTIVFFFLLFQGKCRQTFERCVTQCVKIQRCRILPRSFHPLCNEEMAFDPILPRVMSSCRIVYALRTPTTV